LAEVARAVRDGVRKSDAVARFGGDEFAIFLPRTSAGQAKVIAERMLRSVRKISLENEAPALASISIGIAVTPAHATTADGLLHCADLAMYIAKLHGGNRAQLYDSSIEEAG